MLLVTPTDNMRFQSRPILYNSFQSKRFNISSLNPMVTSCFSSTSTNYQSVRNKKKLSNIGEFVNIIRDSHGVRTHDPNIKSVVLYQLS